MSDSWWTTPVSYGGNRVQSPAQMREAAHGVIARTAISSDAEIGLARCVLWLLGEVERLHGEG